MSDLKVRPPVPTDNASKIFATWLTRARKRGGAVL